MPIQHHLALPAPTQNVTLCLVTATASASASASAQLTACAVPQPASAGVTTSTGVTGDAAGPTPPFAGATLAGLLSGVVVNNDASLSCLETENQLADLGRRTTGSTQPALLVWQSPGDQQYYYVAATLNGYSF